MTRVGVLLPTFDPYRQGGPRPVVSAARLAEELGFDGVWAGDHLVCRVPVLDAPVALAAAVTTRWTKYERLRVVVDLLAVPSPPSPDPAHDVVPAADAPS